MDTATLTKWKTLANDAVIATFGETGREQQLAEALEKAVEALDDASNRCAHCGVYDDHGNLDGVAVNADDVLDIHRSLSKVVSKLRDSSVGALAEHLGSLEDGLDELEALTTR